MEELKNKMRMRGNLKTTTKGEFTLDITVEVADFEPTEDNIKAAENLIKVTESDLYESLKQVALSKGLKEPNVQ